MHMPAAQAALDRSALPDTGQLVPAGYKLVSRCPASMDGILVELDRYERVDGRNARLRGEHFSLLVDGDGHLKGLTYMDADFKLESMPTRGRAHELATAFLQVYAQDLLPGMEVNWIAPHDETILVQDAGKSVKLMLTGMKVKCRNSADGLWFWVIVSGDKIMTFERNIVWITFPGHRKTEKWLHDTWLAKRIDKTKREREVNTCLQTQ